MIRVTIDRDGLERGTAKFPIRIEETTGRGRTWRARGEVSLDGDVAIIYSPNDPLKDGARVWIEATDFWADISDIHPEDR